MGCASSRVADQAASGFTVEVLSFAEATPQQRKQFRNGKKRQKKRAAAHESLEPWARLVSLDGSKDSQDHSLVQDVLLVGVTGSDLRSMLWREWEGKGRTGQFRVYWMPLHGPAQAQHKQELDHNALVTIHETAQHAMFYRFQSDELERIANIASYGAHGHRAYGHRAHGLDHSMVQQYERVEHISRIWSSAYGAMPHMALVDLCKQRKLAWRYGRTKLSEFEPPRLIHQLKLFDMRIAGFLTKSFLLGSCESSCSSGCVVSCLFGFGSV
jgi:hypothetical protein